MSQPFDATDLLGVNTLRTLSIDAVQRANSGHPGMPLGAAPMAYVLWQRHLCIDPRDPSWPDRDRFVLSGGHGSMLLYALLHLSGHAVTIDDLMEFRQWGSATPGHPEFGHTPGVEATTGPLGQGTANAVGMAMAERWLAAHHNVDGHTVVDHRTYAIVTDGDLMEGVSNEAASLAGHLGLGKLVYLYDANDVTLDGPASLHFSEDVAARYSALGWHVQTVLDGDTDLAAIDAALTRAEQETAKPSLIVVKTTIGFGSPKKAGSASAHGAPLGEAEVAATKTALGWTATEPFFVPDTVRARFAEAAARGGRARQAWIERFHAWSDAAPDRTSEWEMAFSGNLPDGFDATLPRFGESDHPATRTAGGQALDAMAARVPWLLGGDADLGSSTKTRLSNTRTFGDRDGRNIHFGVREHAMGAIANGMLYHGGVRPFVSTFFVFSDYMRPPLRLAALSKLPLLAVFTHDSVGVGEDGPTHQPVEHLAALRAIPNLLVLRPADGNETSAAWKVALEQTDRPVALVLSRQDLPVYTDADSARAGVARGAWIVHEAPGGTPSVVLIATGSEVALAVQAARELDADGIHTRVVSMPCWELFEEQSADDRRALLAPDAALRVAIEAGVSLGWHRWVGEDGLLVTLDRFGASAPGERVLTELGFAVPNVVAAVKRRLAV